MNTSLPCKRKTKPFLHTIFNFRMEGSVLLYMSDKLGQTYTYSIHILLISLFVKKKCLFIFSVLQEEYIGYGGL